MGRLNWSWGKMAMTVSAVTLGAAAACSTTEDACDPAKWFPDHMPPADECPSFYKDAGADATDGGDAAADGPIEPTCAGQCVPLSPFEWDGPSLVWIGSELQAPPCPVSASKLAYEGHADLNAPNICGGCMCDLPTGACSLPATITASAASCATTNPSTPQAPFDPPAGWDGSCTTNDAVPVGQLCDGGSCCDGGPCVPSITIAPLTVTETGCKPTQLAIPASAPATWKTFARACRWEPHGACAVSGERCGPESPPGFRLCVLQKGDGSCTDPWLAPYAEKHVFYAGFEDKRSCSPCKCNAPSGSVCSAQVSVFTDDACASNPSDTISVDSNAPICTDMIAGAALASKFASSPTYAAGACQPTGSEPMGSADPVDALTVCCIPSL